MFSKYYQSELTYLRDLGKEFALANPTLAAMFAERGGDPDVERLLEGFAFLTARIRERIDDAMPEIVDTLCELTIPQYLQPTPATSIVEFTPNLSALRGRQRIPKGAELGARAEDTVCIFRTTNAIDLAPVTLASTMLDASSETLPELKLSFRTTESSHSAALTAEGLRFFIHAPLPQSTTLFLWFARYLEAVTYVGAGGETRTIPKANLKLVGIDQTQPMLPWPENAPEEMRLLQEYFTLPQKLLFVQLTGLDALDARPTDQFELQFRFRRPPPLPERVERDSFRLHCVPVVNRFEISADPITRDFRAHEYLIRAAGMNPRHAEICAVKSVIGMRERGGRVDYTPFFSFAHAQKSAEKQAYFALRRVHSPLDDAYDAYLSVLVPRDISLNTDDEVLSIDLECTNRNLPASLRVGDISVTTSRSPTIAKFSNITHVTKPVRTPLGSDMHWRLIAHLALNQRSLGEAPALRALLSLYNLQDEADKQVGRANRMRTESVRSIEMKSAKRVIDNIPTRGVQSMIELDEAAFSSLGDLFVFGCALDSVFGCQAPINSFHALSVRAYPSVQEFSWPARTGLATIL